MKRTVHILLVEDDAPQARLIEHLSRSWVSPFQLFRVQDGEEAMQYLRREGSYIQAQRPDLILLDLNLPKKDGREVLKEIKTDSILKRIPTLILTTSSSDKDVCTSYAHQANSFIIKPIDIDDWERTIRTIHDYWLQSVALPRFSPTIL